MEKLIRVKTPLTENGTMPLIGADGRQVYSENILSAAAKKGLEKLNEKLPTALKHIIEDIEPEKDSEPVATTEGVKTTEKINTKKNASNANAVLS